MLPIAAAPSPSSKGGGGSVEVMPGSSGMTWLSPKELPPWQMKLKGACWCHYLRALLLKFSFFGCEITIGLIMVDVTKEIISWYCLFILSLLHTLSSWPGSCHGRCTVVSFCLPAA